MFPEFPLRYIWVYKHRPGQSGSERATAKASTKPWFQQSKDTEAFHINMHGKLNVQMRLWGGG